MQDHVEGYLKLSGKTKTYFSTAVALWDAEFYVKVDDDIHVNIGNDCSSFSRIFSFFLHLWTVYSENYFATYLNFIFSIRVLGSSYGSIKVVQLWSFVCVLYVINTVIGIWRRMILHLAYVIVLL